MHKVLLTTALVLVFGTSAFVSVSALSLVFSSAGIIILMGCGMELGKILTVIYLHRKWKALHWLSRCFYIMVITALVLITSCEIMGYLSQNHIQGLQAFESNRVFLVALDQEEKILRNRIETIDKTLAGLPDSYVSKRIRERQTAGYDSLQARLIKIVNEKMIVEKQQITNKAYSGPIFATAKIFHIDKTRAASLFILFLVAVLEPLSIGLAVAVSITWMPQYPVKQEIDTSDPLLASITNLIDSNGGFSGTVSELLEALNNIGQQELVGKNGWPKAPHALGKRLKSLEQQLAGQGIYVTRSRTEESRKLEIGRTKTIKNI